MHTEIGALAWLDCMQGAAWLLREKIGLTLCSDKYAQEPHLLNGKTCELQQQEPAPELLVDPQH